MMGIQVEPAQLFYEFRFDDHVPADHLLRRIDRFLDLVRPSQATGSGSGFDWVPGVLILELLRAQIAER